MPSAVRKSKRHDDGISLVIQFTPDEDVDWDLEEEGISVVFIARLPTAPAPKVESPAEVIGPWRIRYDPTRDDVNTIGAYDVEAEVTRANGKQVTLPTEGFLSWVISADLNDR